MKTEYDKESKKQSKNIEYDEDDDYQQEKDDFMQAIIEAVMERFNVDYGEASGMLHQLGMWDEKEVDDICTIGHYRGVEHFVEYIEECLKDKEEESKYIT